MLKKILSLLLCLSFIYSVAAQEVPTKKESLFKTYISSDFIYLNDGTYYKGKLLKISHMGTVSFAVSDKNNQVLTFSKDAVRQIILVKDHRKNFNNGNQVRHSGYYGTFSLAINTSYFQQIPTLHLNVSVGKMIGGIFAVGVGTGLELYNTKTAIIFFVPLYTEVRAYQFKKEFTPYVALGIGMGFPPYSANNYSDEGEFIKAGLLIKPSFGIRFNSPRKVNFFGEMGLRIQHTERRYISGYKNQNTTSGFPFSSRPERIPEFWTREEIIFKKISLTLGIIF